MRTVCCLCHSGLTVLSSTYGSPLCSCKAEPPTPTTSIRYAQPHEPRLVYQAKQVVSWGRIDLKSTLMCDLENAVVEGQK